MKLYYLYLIECSDGTYYVGVTNDLIRRVMEHELGINQTCYTFQRRPLKLKYHLTFTNIIEAINYEKRVIRWSRAKKEAFFEKRIEDLHQHAKCKNSTSHELRSSEAET